MYLADSAPQLDCLFPCDATSPDGFLQLANSSSNTSGISNLENFYIKKFLGESDSQVYLIKSKRSKELLVLKVYLYEDGKPHESFLNELQFVYLSHPNLIKTKASRFFDIFNVNKTQYNVSYILHEYALHGDFFDLLTAREIEFSDKLVRTYFHQLIRALEYLHENRVAHLDIKLENIFLNKDYQLQIGDFGLAKLFDARLTEVWGSAIYRSPELKSCCCKNFAASDVYSAGIVLFALKSNGHFPFLEDNLPKFFEESENDCQDAYEEFWEHHTADAEKPRDYYSDEFKELFLSMTKSNPEKRLTIKEIKSSRWYNQDVFTDSELKKEMMNLLDPY